MASSFASGDATHVSFVLQARVRLAEGGMSEELNYIFFFRCLVVFVLLSRLCFAWSLRINKKTIEVFLIENEE